MLDNHPKSIAEGSTLNILSNRKAATVASASLSSNTHASLNQIPSYERAKQQQSSHPVLSTSSPVNVPLKTEAASMNKSNDSPSANQPNTYTTAFDTKRNVQGQTTPLTPPNSPESANITRASKPNLNSHHQQPKSHHPKKKICSTYEYNNRILSAKRNGNIRAVMSEFMTMKRNSVHLTQHTYNLVLEAHAIFRREGTPLNAMLKIYSEMIQSGIHPNAYTYALMIRTLCKRDVEVQKTVAMLRRQSARIGQENWDIQLLESEGNVSKALTMFHYAVTDGTSVQTFDVEIFNQLLRVLSHYGDAANATFVYSQLEQPTMRAKPNSATYAALINLFGRAGDLDTALYYFDVYTQVKQNLGPHDTSYIYNALVDCHLKCGLLEDALHVVEHEMIKHQVKLTSIPYNSIIRHYCTHDQMKEAEELIGRLVSGHEVEPDKYPEPDASSYGPILAAYCQNDKWEDASRIYGALRKTDVTKAYGNLANYALLCLAHGDRNKALSVVQDDMKNANLEPDPVLAGRIIASFGQVNDIAMATETINALQKLISARTLTKGAHHLLDGALEVVAQCSSVQQILKLIHAVQSLVAFISENRAARNSQPYFHQPSQQKGGDRSGLYSYVMICKTLIDSYFQHSQKSQNTTFSIEDYELLFQAALVLYDNEGSYRSHDSLPTSSLGETFVKILSDAHKDGHNFPSEFYTKILHCLQQHGDAEAVYLWKEASSQNNKKHAILVFPDDHTPTLSATSREVQLKTSDKEAKTDKFEDEDDDDIIIQIAKEKNNESSEELSSTKATHLRTLRRSDCAPSSHNADDIDNDSTSMFSYAVSATNEILKAVIHLDHPKAVRVFENKLICRGLVPDPEVMRDVIALAGKQGDMQTALTLYNNAIYSFKDIPDTAAKDHAIYMATNSILIGYAQAGDMEKGKVYYDRIKAMGRFPDSNGYASMLLGTAKSATITDEATEALAIYDEAKRHNVRPTTFFYNVIISKLAKARKLDVALNLFEEMRLFKIPANSITYGAIISASVRSGSEAHSRRLFGEMLSSPSYLPRVGPFNNMMQFYVRQQPNRERVLEYFSELRRRRIKPSPHSYKLLMEAYTHIAPYNMPMAHKLLSDMVRCDSLRPQTSHYTTLIYSYGILQRDVQSAERVFSEMKKAGISPDEGVYQALIDTFISNGALEKAEHMYTTEIRKEHHHGSPYIENLFIRGYGEKGDVAKAEAIFEAMSDDKTQFDKYVIREPSTYEALIRAYLQNGLTDKARHVLEKMIKRDFPPKVVGAVAELLTDE